MKSVHVTTSINKAMAALLMLVTLSMAMKK